MATNSTSAPDTAPTVDVEAIKTRQQATWATGDYAVIGTTLQLVGELLCESVDVAAGWRVLDVAAGNGNGALAAARRGCEVTAVDYVPELLASLRARADAEGVAVATVEADAEALDAADGSSDAVLSTFGVMFTPHQERAAAELVRVCRPGGRIGLASWTPDSFVGEMLRTVGRFVTPPAGIRSPLEWGAEARLEELFGRHAAGMRSTERQFVFRYRSAPEFLALFRRYYGPMATAFETLDAAGREALLGELTALADAHDTGAGTLRVPSTYLETVIDLRP